MSADKKKVVSNENLAAFAEALAAKVPLKSDLPTKVSDLANDTGFTTNEGTITSVTLNGTTTSSGGVNLGYLVVQESGKRLSSNDYTTIEKEKLAGIEAGAEANIIETVKVNGTAQTPDSSKAIDISVPTTVAELSDASDYALSADLEEAEYVTSQSLNDLNSRVVTLENAEFIETDPTVPAWAKEATKPTYTASEVGALPSDTVIPTKTSELQNDSGFLTSHQDISGKQDILTFDTVPTENSINPVTSGGLYTVITDNELVVSTALNDLNSRVLDLEEVTVPTKTSDLTNDSGFITSESDPTVPEWAKASTKPTYTAAEVGALPDTTVIPDVSGFFDEVAYDSGTKRINFKQGTTVKKYIDATDFIKDGMVNSVEISTPESGTNAGVSCLVVTFNTDAGKEDIEIPLSSIFNPSNYYTKTEIEARDLWEPGTGTGSAVLKGSGNIASGNYSVAEGCEDISKVGFTVRALTDSEKSRISSKYGKDGALYSGFLDSTWDPDTGTTSYTIYSDPACIQQAAVFSGTNIFFSDDAVSTDDNSSFCGYIFNIPDSGSLTPGNTYYHVFRRGGNPTRATGLASHAEGLTTTASGDASHAEGQYTYAMGDYSHAEGDGPIAYGRSSHAEGITTHANGGHSHAEGYGSTAGGNGSHAEGSLTSATGEYSHTEGWHTHTQNLGEHAEGKYNRSVQNKTIHSTGIGDGDEHEEMNAFEIWNDGKIFLYNVYGYDGTNSSSSTSIQEFLDITPFSSEEYDSLFIGNPDFNYIYFDDYPEKEEEQMSGGIAEYADKDGTSASTLVSAICQYIDSPSPTSNTLISGVNCYKYTGEIFEYNNTSYWLFQVYDPIEEDWINNSNVQYMLVETDKTLAGLTAQSLESNVNNTTIPYYALLSSDDNSVYRLGEDSDDILIAVR